MERSIGRTSRDDSNISFPAMIVISESREGKTKVGEGLNVRAAKATDCISEESRVRFCEAA